jgi:hypothetical protein
MWLIARGWTNVAIAERLRLHPKSVSRIIGRNLARELGRGENKKKDEKPNHLGPFPSLYERRLS